MVEDEGLCFLCLAPCNDLCPHCKLVHFCSQDHLRLHRYYSIVTKKHLQCKRYPQSRSLQARRRVLAVQSRPTARQGSSSFCNSWSQVSGGPQEEPLSFIFTAATWFFSATNYQNIPLQTTWLCFLVLLVLQLLLSQHILEHPFADHSTWSSSTLAQ